MTWMPLVREEREPYEDGEREPALNVNPISGPIRDHLLDDQPSGEQVFHLAVCLLLLIP
jgi:hypothetical protein